MNRNLKEVTKETILRFLIYELIKRVRLVKAIKLN